MLVIKNKKIVVTGGAGFIGSNIVHNICKDNEVTVIDDISTGRIENIIGLIEEESIKFVKGSINNLNLLQENFFDVDYVLHQAAIPSVPRSIKNPIASNKANVDGTLNVLVAARDCNVEKVIYASSSSVYGDTSVLPKVETMPTFPLSPYAISKLCGEHYCRVFYEVYGIRTTSLRYFNVYGPKQNPKSEYAAVIPRFIYAIIKGKPIEIYGDGEQTRDFTFVEDVVNANLLSCKSKKSDGKILNIAGGKRISINDLALKIMKIMEEEVEIVYKDKREGDVKDSLADISLSKDLIGYTPQYSLEEGLNQTVKYFKSNSE